MIKYVTTKNNLTFNTIAKEDGILLCECKITIDISLNKWTITSWYATEGNGNKGYGTLTLKKCLSDMKRIYGLPKEVDYVWNGSNEYVIEWLNKHFGAISKCPIAVQKNSFDDDWDSHVYVLNRVKFLNYFQLL